MAKKMQNTGEQNNDGGGWKQHRWVFAAAGIVLALLAAAALMFFGGRGGIKTEKAGIQLPERRYNYTAPTEDICRKLKNTDDIDLCLDKIIAAQAVNDLDFEKCGKIKNVSLRNECQLTVARNLSDENLCLKMNVFKGRCLSDVSIAKKDPSVCDLLEDDEIYELQECKDRTMSFIIAEDGDNTNLDDCNDLKTLEYAKLCLINSYENEFGGDCDSVPKFYRDYCLAQNLIEGAPTVGDCDAISVGNSEETANYRDYCYKVAQLGMLKARLIDSDGDGISDGNELFMNLNPNDPDSDGDRLTDGEEWIMYETNPAEKDSDGDGIDDYEEVMASSAE